MKLPVQERADLLALQEVYGFLWRQRNISAKNVKRLKELAASSNAGLARLAEVVVQIASVAPGRRRRFAKIKDAHPLLWGRMIALDLVHCDDEGDDFLQDAGEDWVDGDEFPFDDEGPVLQSPSSLDHDYDIPF